MVVVKPTLTDYFNKIDLNCFANSVSKYLESGKGSLDNQKHLQYILAQTILLSNNIEIQDVDFCVELESKGVPFFLKNYIDIIINKKHEGIIIQILATDDLDIFILECLKLSIEYADFKHVLFFCDPLLYNSYLKIYGNLAKINLLELTNKYNLCFVNNQCKIENFVLEIANDPIFINSNKILVHFKFV